MDLKTKPPNPPNNLWRVWDYVNVIDSQSTLLYYYLTTMFDLNAAITYLLENVTPDSHHWDLPVYEIDGGEYAIGDDDDCDKAVTDYIKESLWAFTPEFLSDHLAGGKLDADDIATLRGDRCEDINDAFLAMVDDFDALVEDAIASDGRGHFLNPYNGSEEEVGDYYIYRIN